MSSPLAQVLQQIEAAIASTCEGWGKVTSLREAMNLTYSQQASILGPKWAVLQWKESKPVAWGPGLEGQNIGLQLYLIDRGLDSQNRAEAESQVMARFEELFDILKTALLALNHDIGGFQLDFGQAAAPLKKLAESRETPHIALFTCQITAVWPQTIP